MTIIDDPIIDPPIPERVWTSRWISAVRVDSPNASRGTATLAAKGFDPDTEEIQPGNEPREIIEIYDLANVLANVPEAYAVRQALIAAWSPIKAYLATHPEAGEVLRVN